MSPEIPAGIHPVAAVAAAGGSPLVAVAAGTAFAVADSRNSCRSYPETRSPSKWPWQDQPAGPPQGQKSLCSSQIKAQQQQPLRAAEGPARGPSAAFRNGCSTGDIGQAPSPAPCTAQASPCSPGSAVAFGLRYAGHRPANQQQRPRRSLGSASLKPPGNRGRTARASFPPASCCAACPR